MERKDADSLILQNHLYGCFIVMEDIAQGLLEMVEGHLTGNALYLNMETQFGQIGVRYYGFSMDGKAILEDMPVGYREAWLGMFTAAERTKDMIGVDRVEEEVMAILEEVVNRADRYFMNALEHEGNLSPDWIERALYVLHPHLGTGTGTETGTEKGEEVGTPRKRGKEKGKRHGRGLSLTRRKGRGGKSKPAGFGATTRRRVCNNVRESPPNLLGRGE